jgi:hypothetical protein
MINMIPQDYKYITRTRQGWQILSIWQDRYGYLYVVGYRPSANDYFYARSYDPTRGTWASGGSYMWGSLEEAEQEMLSSGLDGPYTRFDVYDPKDIAFEYDAQYNWNNVDDRFLKANSHREPGFSARSRQYSSYGYDRKREGGYFDDGKIYSDDDEGYAQFKRDYRRQNSPWRTMNAAPKTANRTTARKVSKPATKKAPAKKAPAAKPAAKKAPAKKVTKAPAKKTTAKKTTTRRR